MSYQHRFSTRVRIRVSMGSLPRERIFWSTPIKVLTTVKCMIRAFSITCAYVMRMVRNGGTNCLHQRTKVNYCYITEHNSSINIIL